MKVTKIFRDKNTKKVYKKGDTYSGDEKRVAFLIAEGYLAEPKQSKAKAKEDA